MLTIKDLVEANKKQLERINARQIENEPLRKVLIFDKKLPFKDPLINIIDCPLLTNEHRGTHALYVGGVIKANYNNSELYAMHMTAKWKPVIEWAMENGIRVISMSIATWRTEEREQALKKYVEWGGIVLGASGNWQDKSVSYPADSKYTIGVSATNTEDSNGFEVDITVDSWWKAKRYEHDEFTSFTGTSCATPVMVSPAFRYQNANPTGMQEDFRTWTLINSIKNIDHLEYDHSFGNLEPGERFFVYPDDMVDKLVPIEIKLTEGNNAMLVNGEEKPLRVAPFMVQYSKEFGALCTELRPIFEASRFKVKYDDDTNTATISI